MTWAQVAVILTNVWSIVSLFAPPGTIFICVGMCITWGILAVVLAIKEESEGERLMSHAWMSEEQYAAHRRSVARARLVERSAEARTERVEDARKAAGIKAKPNKYHNEKTVVDGRKFASRREAHRWGELLLEMRAGTITDLECQKRHKIVVNGEVVCVYIADFDYVREGQPVTEDAKGMKTDVYVLKRKLMKIVNGIEIGGVMTLRQRAELWISTESISNIEWKQLVRELLERGVFDDDPLKLPAAVREAMGKPE